MLFLTIKYYNRSISCLAFTYSFLDSYLVFSYLVVNNKMY